MSGGANESRSSDDDAGDTDDETDRQAAAEGMNQSVSNPDRRHQTGEGSGGTQPSSGTGDQEEESGDDERTFHHLFFVRFL